MDWGLNMITEKTFVPPTPYQGEKKTLREDTVQEI